MIFLQIWAGDGIPLNRQRCIRSFTSLMRPDDSYMFVTDRPDNTPEIRNISVWSLGAVYADALRSVGRPDWWRRYSERGVQFLTDFVRLWLATQIERLFYADTDILIGRRFTYPTGNDVIMGQWGAGAEPFLFYSGRRGRWFRSMMDSTSQLSPDRVTMRGAFGNPLTRREFDVFCEDTFSHQRLSGRY